MFRSLTPRQLAVDLVVPAVMILLLWASYGGAPAADVTVLFGMGVALAFRRLSPGLALVIAWATAIVQVVLQLAPNPSNLAIAGVLYATAAYGSNRIRWLGFASAPVGALVIALYLVVLPRLAGTALVGGRPWVALSDVAIPATQMFLAAATFFLLSWTLGLLARTWMRGSESRRAQAEAERAIVVEQERNRIARDMHDVVAHSLAVVIAQADGARYAQRTDPAAAEAALATIASTSREALADVRVLLARLRHREGELPQPALSDLERLYESLEASGLSIDRTESGSPVALSTASQLAVYRIAQEALTNALRHGDPASAVSVHFEWADDELRLTVQNRRRSGTAASGAVPGHGLTGMRERASLAGGRLEAGPVDEDFLVEATIPAPAPKAPAPEAPAPKTSAPHAPAGTPADATARKPR